jgi:hypothetical protein
LQIPRIVAGSGRRTSQSIKQLMEQEQAMSHSKALSSTMASLPS